jgi:type I restriction enzyme R subunit
MDKLLEQMDSNEARGDIIKTKIESKLKQIRYDDHCCLKSFLQKSKELLQNMKRQETPINIMP